MLAIIELLRRKDNMTREEFQADWLNNQAETVMRIPGLKSYEQNSILLKEESDAPHESLDGDGISIMRFQSLSDLILATQSKEYRQMLETRSSDSVKSVAVLEHQSIPYTEGDCIKKISFLERRSSTTTDFDFAREWFVRHSQCMYQMPRDVVRGYTQHLVLDRRVDNTPVKDTVLPIDGILELFFTNQDDLKAAFASPPGQETIRHRKEFMKSVTPFIVRSKEFLL